MDDPYICPSRICAYWCDKPIGRARTFLGYTGCDECERLHLNSQIAAWKAGTGPRPSWWIDPEFWDHQDRRDDMRAVYDALKGAKSG